MKISVRSLLYAFVLLQSLILTVSCVRPSASEHQSKLYPDSNPGQGRTDVLIYNGPGTWYFEVESIKSVLYLNGATYQYADDKKLNAMTLKDLALYRLIVFVGGDARVVRKVLTPQTFLNLRQAVQDQGLSYLGFCAGAWMAVEPKTGIVDAPYLELNYLSHAKREFALDQATFPDQSSRKLLWWGGPITPNVAGGVLAKYADGTPAITQVRSGQGLVLLSGLHPAATKPILSHLKIYERQALAPEYAWDLMFAGIQSLPMPAFK